MHPDFLAIQSATLSARARLQDKTIGAVCHKGQFQVVRVTYDKKGKSTVQRLGPLEGVASVIVRLNELGY